jgi:DNA modification methylase
MAYLSENDVYFGDCISLMPQIEPNSTALSFWSPPYHVGKQYEAGVSVAEWRRLVIDAISLHRHVLTPGGFCVVNIADILAFPDITMPRIQALNPGRRKYAITREDVLAAQAANPGANRDQLARLLGCSEQTIDRRLNGNNIRGGKHAPQTRVHLVAQLIEVAARRAGLFLYDRRAWVKDPAWESSQWHSLSYRAVDEFEYLYMLWKPGVTKVDRSRLRREEWALWGSRAVWNIPSVRQNDAHEAMFPIELANRVIRLLSDPGDLVLDPFAGSGTTLVAARQLGRRFIGIEKEASYVRVAQQRLARALNEGQTASLWGQAESVDRDSA